MATAHDNHNGVVISRTNLNLAALVFGTLIIILFVMGYKLLNGSAIEPGPVLRNGVQVPYNSDLTDFLKKNNFIITLHVQQDGLIKPVDINGNEKEPCGEIRDGKIFPMPGAPGYCPTISEEGIEIDSMVPKNYFMVKINPNCFGGGGYLFC